MKLLVVIATLFALAQTHEAAMLCYVTELSQSALEESRFDVCTHALVEGWQIHDIIQNIGSNFGRHLRLVRNIVDRSTIEEAGNKPRLIGAVRERNECAAFQYILALKRYHPHLKVLPVVGGWNASASTFSKMAADPKTKHQFIDHVFHLIEQCKLDGLVFQSEFLTQNGGKPSDRENYVRLIKDLKKHFQPKGFILMATAGSNDLMVDSADYLAELNYYLDYMILNVEYHGPWDGVVGSNSPLRGLDVKDKNNLEDNIKYLLNQGVNRSKIIINLRLDGKAYILENKTVDKVEFGITPVKYLGFKGPRTREVGVVACDEISKMLTESPWRGEWHETSFTPYRRNRRGRGDRLLSFDNGRSTSLKAMMAVEYGLGGFALGTMNIDITKDSCPVEDDAYIDFGERFKVMKNNPLLPEALETLQAQNKFENNLYYVLHNGQLELRLPEPKAGLLFTLKDAILLAREQKTIQDAIETIQAESSEAWRVSPTVLCVVVLVSPFIIAC